MLKNVLQPDCYLVVYWELPHGASGARKARLKIWPFFAVWGVISWRVPSARQLISLGGRAVPGPRTPCQIFGTLRVRCGSTLAKLACVCPQNPSELLAVHVHWLTGASNWGVCLGCTVIRRCTSLRSAPSFYLLPIPTGLIQP